MTILQKQAWIGLGGATACICIAGAGIGLAVRFNAKGVVPLIACVVGALIGGFVSCLGAIRIQARLDERERKISVWAFVISSYVLVAFLGFASFGIFFLSGARNYIPVYTLPALLLIGMFVSQLVQSAVILIKFAQEQADEK